MWFESDDDDFECRLNPSSSSLYESTRLYQSMDSAATIRPRRPPIALPPPPPRSAPPLGDSSQQHAIDTVPITSTEPSGSSPVNINGIDQVLATCNSVLTKRANTMEDPCFLSHVESNHMTVGHHLYTTNSNYHISGFSLLSLPLTKLHFDVMICIA